MTKTTKTNGQAQGAEPSKQKDLKDLPAPTQKQIKEWLKRDLQMSIHVLDAIYTDQDLLEMVSAHMYGRMMNYRHKEELKNQGELNLQP